MNKEEFLLFELRMWVYVGFTVKVHNFQYGQLNRVEKECALNTKYLLMHMKISFINSQSDITS